MVLISKNFFVSSLIIVATALITSCSSYQSGGTNLQGKVDLSSSMSAENFKMDINLKVEKFILDNGLTLLLVKNDHLPIFSYYTFVKVGAKYEKPGITGASHFLEHLMFKGAKKYGMGKFDRIIESSGGSSNAYTSMDLTVYHEDLPISALETIIDIEADRMENLLLDPIAFEKERKVILEERKFRYENSPQGQMFLALMQSMFKNTPYGGSVIGDIPDLNSVTRDQIFQYFKDFYAPNNAVIVIVGEIDQKKTLQMIKEKFSSIPKSQSVEDLKEERNNSELYSFKTDLGKETKLHGQIPTPIFTLTYPGEPAGTRRSYIMDILASVLGDGNSSYLVQEYVQSKKPILSGIYAANYNLQQNGLFMIGGEMLNDNLPQVFQKAFKKDLQKVCSEAINERSVQKAKNQYFISYYDELETNAGIAEFIGLHEVYFGDFAHYKEEIEHYKSVTTEEVHDVCVQILEKGKANFISVWDQYPKEK